MRVFLTGATGFIGRATLPALAVRHDVRWLSRSARGAGAVSGDFGAPAQWRGQLRAFRPEVCLHLAWEGLPDYSPRRCQQNVAASLELAREMLMLGCRRIVVAGSCWEYGEVSCSASEGIAESTPSSNPGVFAQAKDELRRALEEETRRAGAELVWTRIFFVYGAGQRSSSLIPHCVAQCQRGEEPDIKRPDDIQDFIHVEDVAGALAALIESAVAPGIYNVGSGKGTSAAQVAALVASQFGVRLCARSAAGRGFWADIRKLRAAAKWKPGIDIEAGVARTVTALRAEKVNALSPSETRPA